MEWISSKLQRYFLFIFKGNNHQVLTSFFGGGSVEITCAPPAAADDSGVLVTVSSSTVGSQAVYSCQEGRRLVGSMTRKCLVSGLWEGGQPDCECRT
jgi:hypothetical protein